MSRRMMSLNAFLMATGHHVAGWRHPDAQADGGLDFAHYRQLARTAERGCFDALFLSDTLAMLPGDREALSRMARTEHFEPLTLLAALAAVTERVGLVATVTTSYNQVETLAQAFTSLEALSGQRSGWNLVTSSNAQEAFNFGRDGHFEHARRYELARRFLEQLQRHWASAGVTPVQVLAGASRAGCELAAAHAEVVFTAQPELAGAQRFYRELKALLPRFGRSAEHPSTVLAHGRSTWPSGAGGRRPADCRPDGAMVYRGRRRWFQCDAGVSARCPGCLRRQGGT